MKVILFSICIGSLILSTNSACAQNVWTQHNDQSRTGWYPYETTLNTTNVNKNSFGLAFKYTVDDKIAAQPLIVKKVNLPSVGVKNIVLVATQNNSIYAFDADASAPAYWTVNYSGFIAPHGTLCPTCRPQLPSEMHPSLCGGSYGDFHENMGIISTPVIDTSAGIMYFVTKIVKPDDGPLDNHQFQPGIEDEYTYTTTCFHQYLHAIDITTGAEKSFSPVEIIATVNGTGDGSLLGKIKFDPRRQFSRAGLVLSQGKVYITYAAHCDFNPSHGWVISYNAANFNFSAAFNATPNDGRGGIWMSGVAPAVDASGKLYVATGNSLNVTKAATDGNEHSFFSLPPTDLANRGESVVQLNPDLTFSNYWTPWNYNLLNQADLDFGTQIMLLPNTNLAMTQCKDGFIYILQRDDLGGFNPTYNRIVQPQYVENGSTMHSTLAYFGGPTPFAYQYSENSPLKAYPVSASGLGTEIVNNTIAPPTGSSGGFLSVSSNGGDPKTGVLWANQAANGCDANQSICPGILHAVDASNIKNELWNSTMTAGDGITIFNKFICPSIALGKVFLAANSNQLLVYGPKLDITCVTNIAVNKNVTALTNNANAQQVVDANNGTSWTGTAANKDSIFIDLGFTYDICRVQINWNGANIGKDFDLNYSQDGTNWTTLQSVRENTASSSQYSSGISARFICMKGFASLSGTGYSISEFQVYGSPSSSCPPPAGLAATPASVSSIFTTQIPSGATTQDDPNGIEVGLKFRSALPGTITGIKFYKTAGLNGTHTGQLYDNTTRALLGQAVFTNESASGWQTANLATPVTISANKTYVAASFSSQGFYTNDNLYFTTAGITSGPLTALQDGTDGPNAPYVHSATPAFPDQFFNQSNYWVDVVFANGNPANSETINWTAQSGVTQYLIKYRPNLSASWIYRTSNTNAVTLSALSCGVLYFYTVQAICGGSQSSVSQGSFTPTACSGGAVCDLLPTRYFATDLGDVGVAGSTCRAGTIYTLNGSGIDIGGTNDQFQFAFTNGNDIGDYQASATIIEHNQQNVNSKTGIMIRDSMTNTSRYAYLYFSNGKFTYSYRAQPSGPVQSVTIPGNYSLPYFVRLVKTATSYTAFISSNASTWTVVGTKELNFGNDPGNTPHYGMAVTSANNAALSSGKIGDFTLVGSATLPIQLLSFTAANINNDHTLISWSTATEHLVDHFEIERSSDKKEFTKISKVAAVGESQITEFYFTSDSNPLMGESFYRLKGIDKDGGFYYSEIVSVIFTAAKGVTMFPNPVTNYTTVNSFTDPIIELKIFDAVGKQIQHLIPVGQPASININTSELARGIYIVTVKTLNDTIYQQKLVRQ